ncbi:hypothetical protein HDU97_005561 [Phlyctochytrium planicorne]|nr:hypothetical protein HDU97_005561 [Phlyctochytrium planicorne]
MILSALIAIVSTSSSVIALNNGLGRTPAMGWNSYNYFACDPGPTDAVVRQMADKMVELGLRDAGYVYVNLDDCWQAKDRASNGDIIADPARFPHGLKPLADYVHSKNLKFGVYSSAGSHTCIGYRPGGLGYEDRDAKYYASVGVDLLKYDNCWNGFPTTAVTKESNIARYSAMRDALNKTGRAIYYSMCNWGQSSTWTYAVPIANSFRTAGDIYPSFDTFDIRCPCPPPGPCALTQTDIGPSHCSVINILDNQVDITGYSQPGAFGDLDMLEVGNGMSENEERAHFSLWAALKSPLILGNNLLTMTPAQVAIVTNPEIIAVNQDSLGKAAKLTFRQKAIQSVGYVPIWDVWAGPLSDGSTVAVVLNRRNNVQSFDFQPSMAGLDNTKTYKVRDLWSRSNIGTVTGSLKLSNMPAHSVRVLKLTKA